MNHQLEITRQLETVPRFKAILELFRLNRLDFTGLKGLLPGRSLSKKEPVSFNNFVLFFNDHTKTPIGYITDKNTNEVFAFTHKINIGEKRPEGAEPVFTAFPKQMYVLQTYKGEWVIYGLDPNGKTRTVVIDDQIRQPVDPGQVRRDVPRQSPEQN